MDILKGAVALTVPKKEQKTATGRCQKPSFAVKYNYAKYFTARLYAIRGRISTGNSHGHRRNDSGR